MRVGRRRPAGRKQPIQIIDKDDTRRMLAGFEKQFPDTGSPKVDEHLHELGAAESKKAKAALPGGSFGQQGFARARRADQQNAFWQAATEGRIILRSAQEIDYFRYGLFGLIQATHIGK